MLFVDNPYDRKFYNLLRWVSLFFYHLCFLYFLKILDRLVFIVSETFLLRVSIILSIIILDIIWFSITVKNFYSPNLSGIISGNFKYSIAAAFYIIYSFAISYIIIFPNFNLNANVFHVSIMGFIMGIASYSAYNLTNQATIENWPSVVTIVDTLWGGFVTSLASYCTYSIIRYFN